MKTWKYQKHKTGERFHVAPLRPDKACDHDRCDLCGALSPTELRPHKGSHVCLKCKIKLV